MLFETLNLMFKVKQLFTKNYLLVLHIALFLVYFNSSVVFRSQSLMASKQVESRTQPSRPTTREKSEAKVMDRLFEDRPS